jgi:hypothetical protein
MHAHPRKWREVNCKRAVDSRPGHQSIGRMREKTGEAMAKNMKGPRTLWSANGPLFGNHRPRLYRPAADLFFGAGLESGFPLGLATLARSSIKAICGTAEAIAV